MQFGIRSKSDFFFFGWGEGLNSNPSTYENIDIFCREMKALYCVSLLPLVKNNFGTWLFAGYFCSLQHI